MALVLFIGFIGLILLRVPVSMAIGAAVLLAFLTSEFSDALYIVPQQILEGVNKPSLAAVPFFIMAGNLMNAVGMTDRIFNFANALVGHFKAGLAQVNVLSSMIFAGVSGAAVADCAGLGAIEQVPARLGEAIFALTDSQGVFLAVMLVFVLLVGCVVEGVPAKLMLVPMLLPITDSFGIDRVHFGIVLQLALLIGIATPPMGIGLYIMVEVGKVPFERVAVAVLPFLIPLMVVLVMITYMPSLTLWLPNLVLGPE